MKPSHRLADRFVLRAPVLPFAAFAALASPDPAVTRAALRRVLDDPAVREALFIASPDLSTSIESWQDGRATDPAIERAVIRYVARMACRATPFGLFSGVAVGRFGDTSRLALGSRRDHRRHTRLDNDYLAKLATALLEDPAIRRALVFVPSSSLYAAGNRWRYAEGRLTEAGRSYHLVAVEVTPYLEAVVERARTGATLGQLAEVLAADPELSRDEIDAYLDELVAAQIIVPTLQPRVTGPEPGEVMRAMLAAIPAAGPIATVLGETIGTIAAIDEARGAQPAAYRDIAAMLGALPAEVTLARLLQVDLELAMPAATLGPKVATELLRAFELVRRLTPPPPATDVWARFRAAFEARYESREVPLVEVLDEESGIGFGDAPADTAQAPLINDLVFPGVAAATPVTWNARTQLLLRLVSEVLTRGSAELVLGDKDVTALASEPGPLADTLTFSVNVLAASPEALEAGELLIRAEGFGSSSATRLFGRFCHGSTAITSLVTELVAHEQAHAGDAVLAEIVHLPEGRLGNILLRPVLRGYEIPYLGESGADPEHQIPVTDLLVSVVGDRVILRSQRLGKEIRPQLATAHNFSQRSLVIYRFLCAHAAQHARGGQWSWGPLEHAPFLPRVRHGKVILSRARWTLDRDELQKLEHAAAARELRARRRLPRWVVLADYDNELPVDFDNELSLDSFASLVKSRTSATLYELLPAPDQLVLQGPDGLHAHELVVSLVRETPAPPRELRTPAVKVARRFPPGSSWLYTKLYAGTATSDTLLRELVAPFVRDVLGEGLADRFFFIRYADPEHHLRLRFRGDPARLAGELLPRLHAAVAPAVERGLVWRVQLDTYEREVERYGGDHAIELAEDLFAADSEAVLAIVETTPGDDGAQARWRLTARGLDQLLADFGMPIAERLALATRVRDGFGAEHGMDTAFQKRLGDKFRAHKDELAALLAAPATDSEHDFAPALAAFARRSERITAIAEALRRAPLASSLAELAASFWHMHANRMLASMQRRQELVLYDLLRRHYDGVLARERAAARKR